MPKPKHNRPPSMFIILDDLIGENKRFNQQSLINNITIKHRHLGVNWIFTYTCMVSTNDYNKRWKQHQDAGEDMILHRAIKEK